MEARKTATAAAVAYPNEEYKRITVAGIPDNVILKQYRVDLRAKPPSWMNENFRRAVNRLNDFYNSSASRDYEMPAKLPIPGMLVASWQVNRWNPALVTTAIFIDSDSGNAVCKVLNLQNRAETTVRVQCLRLLDNTFWEIFSLAVVDVAPEQQCQIVINQLPPPEELNSATEKINYYDLLPSDVMPFSFKFVVDSLLQPAIDNLSSATTEADYFTLATVPMRFERITSPGSFFFTDVRRSASQKEMLETLIKSYTTFDDDPYVIPSELLRKDLAVIMYDTSWPDRGYVTEIIDENTCQVYKVDSGDIVQVRTMDLRFIRECLSQYPIYGFRGRLAGIIPKRKVWEATTRDLLLKLSNARRKIMVGLVRNITKDGVAELFICQTDLQSPDIWLNDELVRVGLAEYDKKDQRAEFQDAKAESNNAAAILQRAYNAMLRMRPSDWSKPIS